MTAEEDFDVFYRDTRFDVAHQVFCHTGDLTAAQSATRDAFEIAWQHWKKVVRREAITGEDPLSYVRPLAYRLAARRHVGRVWHRRRGLTAEHRATLDALHRLSSSERRLYLVSELGEVPIEDAAREVALTRDAARQRLERVRERLARNLGDDYADKVRELSEPADRARLPRPSVVMRAGRKRRRIAIVVGVGTALAVTIGGGALAREPGMDRATALHQIVPNGEPVGLEMPEGIRLTKPAQLLQPADLDALTGDQTWRAVRTDTNTAGNGLNAVCQQSRFADPRAVAGLVRTFEATGGSARSAMQSVEISRDAEAAQAAYSRAVGWYSGCTIPGFQFQSAYQINGVGDEAQLLQVKVSGGADISNYDIAMVRLGEVFTSFVMRTSGGAGPAPADIANSLAATVKRLCPDGDSCASTPAAVAVPPPPSTEEHGFVATIDLPMVDGIRDPWVGVKSVAVEKGEDDTTRCDKADFVGAGASSARSRTYVIPQADLPDTFGFTETYAVFPDAAAASDYLGQLRDRVNKCADDELTITVSKEQRETVDGAYTLSAWRIENKLEAKKSIYFRVGFVQVGNTIAKLSLIPDGEADMTDADFVWLSRRAGERLRELGDLT